MKKCKLLVSIIILIYAGTANAAGNWGNPNGKPFIEIQGQFIEVTQKITNMQAHIDSIVAQVDSVEDRVDANENAISSLLAQNVSSAEEISTLIAKSAENSTTIAEAVDRIAYLEAELAQLVIDIATNSDAINAIELELTELRDFVASNTSGLLTLEEEMRQNLLTIEAIEEELIELRLILTRKQEILDGTCPAGMALNSISPDGSIICEEVGSQSGRIQVQSHILIPPYAGGVARHISCPTTHTRIVHGGYLVPSTASVFQAEPLVNRSPDAWVVGVRNNSIAPFILILNAVCEL